MPFNVLITAGSRRVALVQAFQRAVRAIGGGRVLVTDVNDQSPTVYVADRSFRAPLSTDPAYIDAILDLCRAEQVSLVVPTIDDELSRFAAERARFEAAGIRVAVSPLETTDICNDKWKTCQVLREHGIAAVESYLPSTLPARPRFPLFIKPRTGRGSVAAFPVQDRRQLDFFLGYVADPVVQPYLDGPEFTIDVLCGLRGQPLAVVPRERLVIRSGVTDRGRTTRDPRLMDLAIACTAALAFVGPVNIQCRVVNDVPTVFEINPRFSGGIGLTIAAGADFARMLVDLARGARVRPAIGRFTDRLLMTSYESSVFLPMSAVGFSSECAIVPEVAS